MTEHIVLRKHLLHNGPVIILYDCPLWLVGLSTKLYRASTSSSVCLNRHIRRFRYSWYLYSDRQRRLLTPFPMMSKGDEQWKNSQQKDDECKDR